MIDLSVIVPCYNEGSNIKDFVLRIIDMFNKNTINGEVVFVNDGSRDDTGAKIGKFSREFKNVIGVNHYKKLGIAEAWNSGLESSQGRYVVTIDADLQYNPEDILGLYKEITSDNYDLVQAWRKEYKDRDRFRKFLSRSLSYLLNVLFVTSIKDIKSGFVMYRREVFFEILKDRKKFRTFQHFFILSALKKGYKIRQVPITFYPRIRGESFIKNPVFFSFRVLSDIPKAILDFGAITRKRAGRRI